MFRAKRPAFPTLRARLLCGRAPLAAAFSVLCLMSPGALGLSACSHPKAPTQPPSLTTEQIDQNPLWLLPSTGILYGSIDAKAFFAASYAGPLTQVATTLAALPSEAHFEPAKDLKQLYFATGSSTSLDGLVLAQGHFDQAAIRAAVQKGDLKVFGSTVSTSTYAGQTLYGTSRGGIVVLTPSTALLGSTTALRRALDRVQGGISHSDVPDWVQQTFQKKDASLALTADWSSQPIPAAFSAELPFLAGAKQARVTGDFLAPGAHLTCTVHYADAAGASQGASRMQQLASVAGAMSFLSLVGLRSPVQSMQVEPTSDTPDATLHVTVDGDGLLGALRSLGVKAPTQ